MRFFFDRALERAKELDGHYGKHDTAIRPLYGLPVSLKDQFHVKSIDTTTGYVGWIGSNMGIEPPSKPHKVESQAIHADNRAWGWEAGAHLAVAGVESHGRRLDQDGAWQKLTLPSGHGEQHHWACTKPPWPC